ncbi:hypothetical protein WJX77_009811 [Trebouxia sp. C0004]
MREAARQSDAASKADVGYDCHPLQQTGVHGSHACMKIPGWDVQKSRSPDPMHTVTNEVKAICGMVKGGSCAIYSVGHLAEVAQWEITYNGRWHVLGPYLAGDKLRQDLPWCATPSQFTAIVSRCKDMTSPAFPEA